MAGDGVHVKHVIYRCSYFAVVHRVFAQICLYVQHFRYQLRRATVSVACQVSAWLDARSSVQTEGAIFVPEQLQLQVYADAVAGVGGLVEPVPYVVMPTVNEGFFLSLCYLMLLINSCLAIWSFRSQTVHMCWYNAQRVATSEATTLWAVESGITSERLSFI